MMGCKKPADYRKELLQHFTKRGINPLHWLDEQIRKHEQEPEPSAIGLETLRSLQNSLRRAVKEKRKRTRRVAGVKK